MEALVALVLAAATVGGALEVRNATLALGSASAQAALAAANARQGAAVALRAPCRVVPGAVERPSTPTHWSRWTMIPGTVSELWVRERWTVAGLGWHQAHTVTGRIGVRCE